MSEEVDNEQHDEKDFQRKIFIGVYANLRPPISFFENLSPHVVHYLLLTSLYSTVSIDIVTILRSLYMVSYCVFSCLVNVLLLLLH